MSAERRAARPRGRKTDAAAPSAIVVLRLQDLGGLPAAKDIFARARSASFDAVLLEPLLGEGPSGDPAAPADETRLCSDLGGGPALDTLARLSEAAHGVGLKLLLDLAPARLDAAHPLVRANRSAFSVSRMWRDGGPIDPRDPREVPGLALGRLRDPEAAEVLEPAIRAMITDLETAGLDGVRLLDPGAAGAATWRRLLRPGPSRARGAGAMFILAETRGLDRGLVPGLEGAPFDAVTSSLPHWDGRAPWFVEEIRALSILAPVFHPLDPLDPHLASKGPGPASDALPLLALGLGGGVLASSAALGEGRGPPWSEAARTALARGLAKEPARARAPGAAPEGSAAPERPQRPSLVQATGPGRPVTVLVRIPPRGADGARIILINPSPKASATLPANLLEGVEFTPMGDGETALRLLGPGEVRVLEAAPRALAPPPPLDLREAVGAARIVIEGVAPTTQTDGFAVKRVVGELLAVEADVFSDGHEALGVELLWRPSGETDWSAARMAALGNDRWSAAVPLERLGRLEFRIEAWIDRFAGLRSDLVKKIDGGVITDLDLEEGILLVEAAARRVAADEAGVTRGDGVAEGLEALAVGLRRASPPTVQGLLLAPETASLMARADPRPFRVTSSPTDVEVERLRARFASWYELFPRSQGREAGRHGDFDDVIARLPAVRAMGFDVLYLPPIHPIGVSHRKGPNNTLTAGPDDPGSPYAIGAEEGGHDAVHPRLGGLAAFRRLIAAAEDQGLEIALDFAVQCSPDHPWLKEHRGWFDWRPDGSLKYAENPPKKYQDIVNVDFYGPDARPGLWTALRDVVRFWVAEGVRTFRVDNPHTKPLPFWRWLIADIRSERPDVIFLSEAFTRPKMMYRLAKAGFSQSYTYFTWRHTKAEFETYLTELADGPPREFFRPHFFVNTPDINPVFLQTTGRPGHLIRAALAATLSGLFGVYSGFELLDAVPIPGKEEYLNSEKFELRQRDWAAAPNIIPEITLLNRIRRENPALQTHLGIAFHRATNDQVLFFSKGAPGADLIVAAISLNPFGAEAADMEVPLWRLGLGDDADVQAEDLVSGDSFTWRGARQWVRLEPERPYALWRLQGEVRR